MAVHMFDTQVVTTTGVKAANSLTKFPEFGATASVLLSAGSATVQLRAWNNTGAKEILATFTLPVPSGAKVDGTPDTGANRVNWLVLTYSSRGSRWEGNWLKVPA